MLRKGILKDQGQPIAARNTIPKRDFLILPLLVLVTVVALFLASNTIATKTFKESTADSCAAFDPVIVSRYKPNCISHVKAAEGPWVVNRFNACGLRSNAPCGQLPAGATRIVLLGSSASFAAYVEEEQGFSSVAAVTLERHYGKPIEVQNMGRVACSPICTLHRLDEAFALHPDILMMTVSPHDLEMLDPEGMAHRNVPMSGLGGLAGTAAHAGMLARMKTALLGSRATYAIEHYLFQSPLTYLRVYMNYGGSAAYLRPQLPPDWQMHLSSFDIILDEISARAKSQNIPFILVEMPSLAQASLSGLRGGFPNADPNALNNELATMCRRRGVQFIDPLIDFKSRPDTNKLFYVMDGHMNAAGNKLVGDVVAREIEQTHLSVLEHSTGNVPQAGMNN